MRTLRLGLLLALVGAAPATAQPRWFGFNHNTVAHEGLTPAQDSRLLERLGANSSRLTVEWRYTQLKDGGRIGFGAYEPAYRAQLKRGIRPLITLLGSPPWAWTPWVWCTAGRPCHYPPDRSMDEQWRRYVTAVARTFPRAVGIEIWNEPNIRGFWESGPDPVRYSELLRIAHAAIKAVDPRMPVVAGALAPDLTNGVSSRQLGVRPFLRAMYAAGAPMDALSIHAYPQDRPHGLSFQAIGIAAETRDAAGSRVPLWITETGMRLRTAGSERAQAVILEDLLRRLQRRPGVEAIYVHELVERAREPGFGVVRRDRSRAPAFCAVQEATGAPQPCPAPRRTDFERRLWDAQERVMEGIEAQLELRRRTGRYADGDRARVCERELCVTMVFGGDWIFEPRPW